MKKRDKNSNSSKEKQKDKSHKIEDSPSITKILIEKFISMYQPTSTLGADVELMTTVDIMEELYPICEVEKNEIVAVLSKFGFSLHHNEAGSFWLLKRK